MTYTQFKNKWLGKGIDFDGHYASQCMDVYRMYVKEVLGCPQSTGVKGAKDVWTTFLPQYFDRIPNSPTGVPQQGDIVIWGMQPYGHIAICDKATTSTLTCFEQNWKELDGSGVTELRLHGNYNNVLGWLHFKGSIIEDMISDEEKRILDFIKERKITEGQLRQMADWLKDNVVAEQDEEIKGLKATISDQYTEMDKKNLEYGKLLEDFNVLLPKYEDLLLEKQDWQTCPISAKDLSIKELWKLLIYKIFHDK